VADRSKLQPGDAVAAIIILDDGRYLMQLRDDKPGIFFPGHWGLFGGGVEVGEQPTSALCRELEEELGMTVTEMRPVTRFEFDLTPLGLGRIYREFFEVCLPVTAVALIRLGEGKALQAFNREQVLSLSRVTPYDSFALWFHVNNFRLHT
jgi:8-oxo-dGTP pyrophosphatase MutT (NUDIX family)